MILKDSLLRGGVWYNVWRPEAEKKSPDSLWFIPSFFSALDTHEFSYDARLPGAVLSREKRQSTNLGNGISIPHPNHDDAFDAAQGDEGSADTIFLVYPRFPLKWDDGTHVFAVFFVCMENKEKHLQALSELARTFSRSSMLERLRNHEALDAVLAEIDLAKLR
jgi:mannitol/fructose-specific phosphotransferase system IIA component